MQKLYDRHVGLFLLVVLCSLPFMSDQPAARPPGSQNPEISAEGTAVLEPEAQDAALEIQAQELERREAMLDAADRYEAPTQRLTARQAAFVDEYLLDNNITKAAIRAGYSPASAYVCGSNALRLPHVAFAIERAKANRAVRVGMTQDSVLHELALLANSSIDHYYVDDQGRLRPTPEAPEGAMRAIASMKMVTRIDKEGAVQRSVEFKLWDKPGSVKLMGKHTGLFADRLEVTGKNGAPLEVVSRVERVVVDAPPELPAPASDGE